MGYKPQRKAYLLRFQGTEWDGLEVTAHNLTTGDLLDSEAARVTRVAGGTVAEGWVEEMIRRLGGNLVSWNLEDESGQPVPATPESLLSQDSDMVLAIVKAWNSAMSEVPAPLPEPSSAGGQSALEASIPMDAP
jgi:hypothetical protein